MGKHETAVCGWLLGTWHGTHYIERRQATGDECHNGLHKCLPRLVICTDNGLVVITKFIWGSTADAVRQSTTEDIQVELNKRSCRWLQWNVVATTRCYDGISQRQQKVL
jgi:hypothetical protein